MHRTAAQLMAAHPSEADAIAERLELELEAGPDFGRCHRGSDFRSPPKVNTDRNFVARLMFIARTIERNSWAGRAKGKPALRLLEILLFVANKRGCCLTPCYDTLARLTCMSRHAIVTAMGVLEHMGFVTIHRRIKRIHTPFGVKVVQDSNAYEFHLPKGFGLLAWSIFGPRSGCNKCPASEVRREKQRKKEAYRAQVEAVIPPF
jgi:hypothetical protein